MIRTGKKRERQAGNYRNPHFFRVSNAHFGIKKRPERSDNRKIVQEVVNNGRKMEEVQKDFDKYTKQLIEMKKKCVKMA